MVEKPDYFQINSVHIGNFGSAFVEVLVGRKGLVAGKDGFVGLLPSSSFQDPLEARSEKNANRVKLFTGVVNNTVPISSIYLYKAFLLLVSACEKLRKIRTGKKLNLSIASSSLIHCGVKVCNHIWWLQRKNSTNRQPHRNGTK